MRSIRQSAKSALLAAAADTQRCDSRDAKRDREYAQATGINLGETSAQGSRQLRNRIGRSAAAGSAICHFVDEARDRALLRQ
jgi:hypothetical protein